jgi:pilus assembly protein CpaE
VSAVTNRIRVVLVDDSYLVRQSVKAMLEFDAGEFEVVGEAENGLQAVEQVAKLQPDVVLMDINMPIMNGIDATIKIMEQSPVGVVIISVQGEQEYLRRAMKAGARDYLLKPFTHEQLVGALRSAAISTHRTLSVVKPAHAQRHAKVVTVFSTKGGVGKTTLVANLASALAQGTKRKVAALDLDLEFGVLATMMGVTPQGSLIDLCRLETPITFDHISRLLAVQKQCGVGVLASPPLPHLASEVDGDGRADQERSYVTEIIEAMRASVDYLIIDTSLSFREANLIALDKADLILMVAVPEITALESTAKGLDVLLERLEYPKTKVELVLNRADSTIGLTHEDIAKSLGVAIAHKIPTDERATITAANTGMPIVLKRAKSSPIADALIDLANEVAKLDGEPSKTNDAGQRVMQRNPLGAITQAATASGRRLFGLF